MYDLIIIGSGPSGITAGIYAFRKNLKTLILTKDFVGQAGITGIVENWPGEKQITGPELMNKFEGHLRSYNIEIREEKVNLLEKNDNFIIETDNGKYFSKAVIIATGRKMKKLNIPGEEEFIGKGVGYCTTCDAPLFRNKSVAIIGGGNAGFESAIELTDYAKEVYLFEFSNKIKADEFLQKRAEKKGIKVFKSAKVKEIKGERFVKQINLEDLESGAEKNFEVSGVFIQIGSFSDASFVKDLVDFDENGDIKIDFYTCKTKTNGLFAAGDVTSIRDKQIIISAAEGAKAALSAYNYLKNN